MLTFIFAALIAMPTPLQTVSTSIQRNLAGCVQSLKSSHLPVRSIGFNHPLGQIDYRNIVYYAVGQTSAFHRDSNRRVVIIPLHERIIGGGEYLVGLFEGSFIYKTDRSGIVISIEPASTSKLPLLKRLRGLFLSVPIGFIFPAPPQLYERILSDVDKKKDFEKAVSPIDLISRQHPYTPEEVPGPTEVLKIWSVPTVVAKRMSIMMLGATLFLLGEIPMESYSKGQESSSVLAVTSDMLVSNTERRTRRLVNSESFNIVRYLERFNPLQTPSTLAENLPSNFQGIRVGIVPFQSWKTGPSLRTVSEANQEALLKSWEARMDIVERKLDDPVFIENWFKDLKNHWRSDWPGGGLDPKAFSAFYESGETYYQQEWRGYPSEVALAEILLHPKTLRHPKWDEFVDIVFDLKGWPGWIERTEDRRWEGPSDREGLKKWRKENLK